MLKKHARDLVSDVTPLDELKDFFGDENGEGAGSSTQEVNPTGRLFFRAKPLKPSSSKNATNLGGTGDTGKGENGTGGGGQNGAGGGGGSGGSGGSAGGTGGGGQEKKPLEITNIRAISSGIRTRRVFFTPTTTGKLVVSVLEAGADSDYSTNIESSDVGTVENGTIVIDTVSGERVSVNITLCEDFKGAIKVVANEI
jgi:hypothetical protein